MVASIHFHWDFFRGRLLFWFRGTRAGGTFWLGRFRPSVKLPQTRREGQAGVGTKGPFLSGGFDQPFGTRGRLLQTILTRGQKKTRRESGSSEQRGPGPGARWPRDGIDYPRGNGRKFSLADLQEKQFHRGWAFTSHRSAVGARSSNRHSNTRAVFAFGLDEGFKGDSCPTKQIEKKSRQAWRKLGIRPAQGRGHIKASTETRKCHLGQGPSEPCITRRSGTKGVPAMVTGAGSTTKVAKGVAEHFSGDTRAGGHQGGRSWTNDGGTANRDVPKNGP